MLKEFYEKETRKNFLPAKVQIIMDSNINCCFNCAYFKLLKTHPIMSNYEYLDLRAKCTNEKAISEKKCRGSAVILRSLLNKPAKVRYDCKFFEL